MLYYVWQIVRAAWRSLVAIATVVGLLYLWPDIKGLPEEYQLRWGQVIPDREIVAYVLLALTLICLFWTEVRPLINKWLPRDALSVQLAELRNGLNVELINIFPENPSESDGFVILRRLVLTLSWGKSRAGVIRNISVNVSRIRNPSHKPDQGCVSFSRIQLPTLDDYEYTISFRPGEESTFIMLDTLMLSHNPHQGNTLMSRLYFEKYKPMVGNFAYIGGADGRAKLLLSSPDIEFDISVYGESMRRIKRRVYCYIEKDGEISNIKISRV